MYSHEIINDKDVFIVRDHHHALLPWSIVRTKHEKAPILISLDHHTDSRPAYLSHMFHVHGEDNVNNEALRVQLVSELDYSEENSVKAAIQKLRHDEHIHAATLSDVISIAFVIQLMDSTGTASEEHKQYMEDRFGNGFPWNDDVEEPKPPFTFKVPNNGIFIIPTLCLPWCERMPHNDECQKVLYDSVLEDAFLEEKIREGNEMAVFANIQDIEKQSYILDIDLDYFHTRKAVKPNAIEVFSRLVRNASAITIALEPSCVENLSIEGENLSSEYLLEKIMGHIACA
jgi:hypothetical protein